MLELCNLFRIQFIIYHDKYCEGLYSLERFNVLLKLPISREILQLYIPSFILVLFLSLRTYYANTRTCNIRIAFIVALLSSKFSPEESSFCSVRFFKVLS